MSALTLLPTRELSQPFSLALFSTVREFDPSFSDEAIVPFRAEILET